MNLRIILIAFSILNFQFSILSQLQAPKDFFGFQPGTDRMLFSYEEFISYLQKADEASPMLKMVEIGQSPMGKKMYIAFISSEKNIENLENLKRINKELALNPSLTEDERTAMIRDGKVFFLATLSMHSSEAGPSQAAPLIAYELLTSADPQVRSWLGNVVYMMVPCHNPDGMDMIVDHYKKYKGTKYETSTLRD